MEFVQQFLLRLRRSPIFRLRAILFASLLFIAFWTTALAQGITPMVQLHDDVWMNSFWVWLGISIVGSLIFSAIISAAIESFTAFPIAATFFIFTIGLVGGWFNAEYRANHAIGPAWQGMIDEQARHIIQNFGLFTRADEVKYICKNADTSGDDDSDPIGTTGCRYVTSSRYCSSRDDKGNCTAHRYHMYPWFKFEVTRTGDLNIPDGQLVFSDHCAPSDWNNQLYVSAGLFSSSQNMPSGKKPGVDFCYEIPAEWTKIVSALSVHHPIAGGKYFVQLNWILANPEAFKMSTADVPEFQKRQLLPQILPLTSDSGPYKIDIFGKATGRVGYEHQVVQFLGTLKPPADFQKAMQEQALYTAAVYGPKMGIQLMLNFSYVDEIPNRFQWMNVTKAYLADVATWDRERLPSNLVILNCGVDQAMKMVQFCNLETGMFEGNENLQQDFTSHQPFPFTPQGIFGVINLGAGPTDVSFEGGAINNTLNGVGTGHAFQLVPMDQFKDKRTVLQPKPEQIGRIRESESAETWHLIGMIWLLLCGGGGYTAAKSKE